MEKRTALSVIFVIRLAFFFVSHACVFRLQEASGKAAGTFFFSFPFFLQSVSKFLKVEFPADYAEVKHGGS